NAARSTSGRSRTTAARLLGQTLGLGRRAVRLLELASRPVVARRRAAPRPVLDRVEQRPDEIDRQREHDRRILLPADLQQRLEVAQLDRDRVLADDVGGLRELGRGLELALGVDDLGAPLALGLGLAGDRALHVLRDLNVLDLDRGDLDPPGLRLVVDDLLEVLVELLALAQERVQIGL